MAGAISLTSIYNSAHVLICFAQKPDIQVCHLAERVRVTPLAFQRIIPDLEEPCDRSRVSEGRRNLCKVHIGEPLDNPIDAHLTDGEVFDAILEPKHPPG